MRVAEGAYLAHAVRDEDDGHAGGLQRCDDLAQPVDVAAGQRRGRLVEQQDARLAVDGAGDLDLLAHARARATPTSASRSTAKPEFDEMSAAPRLARRAAADQSRSCPSGA